MRIEHRASQPQDRQWQAAKHSIHPRFSPVYIRDEALLPEIVLEILDVLLTGTKPKLKPAQTIVCNGGSAQMEPRQPHSGAMFDRLPHDQILGAKRLKVDSGSDE